MSIDTKKRFEGYLSDDIFWPTWIFFCKSVCYFPAKVQMRFYAAVC